MCMSVLSSCFYVYHGYLVPKETEGGHHIPETGLTDGCEAPRGCCSPNLGPEKQVSLTIEQSLLPFKGLQQLMIPCLY